MISLLPKDFEGVCESEKSKKKKLNPKIPMKIFRQYDHVFARKRVTSIHGRLYDHVQIGYNYYK